MAKAKTKNKADKKPFICSTCGKTFAMPAHLGRHQTAIHGAVPKTSGKKTKKTRGRGAGKGLFGKKTGRGRVGRPPAIATRFGLAKLSLDELAALITAAKQEAERRLRTFQAMFS